MKLLRRDLRIFLILNGIELSYSDTNNTMSRILVPTDFTEIAHHALRYAISLAKVLKHEVVILHADQHDDKDLDRLMEEVNSNVTDASINVTYIMSHKHFSSITVNDIVTEYRIALIVMGSAGRDADAEKQLFGTNGSEIAEHAKCPVICLPPEFEYTPIKKIAYASDLVSIDREIGRIIEYARALSASVEVFHVAPVFPDLGHTEKMDVQAKIEKIKEEYQFSEIQYEVEKTKHDNEILKGILSFIWRKDVDVLVMYHNHLSAIDEFFASSNISKVLTQIEVPLLVFHKLN
jgi:nucleotide-binding universal stress UspA family protein